MRIAGTDRTGHFFNLKGRYTPGFKGLCIGNLKDILRLQFTAYLQKHLRHIYIFISPLMERKRLSRYISNFPFNSSFEIVVNLSTP